MIGRDDGWKRSGSNFTDSAAKGTRTRTVVRTVLETDSGPRVKEVGSGGNLPPIETRKMKPN